MRFVGRRINPRLNPQNLGLLVFTFALTAFALDPQKRITEFSHQSWGAADGLDEVYSVAQTTDGYIWIAAANGLFQFDGFHFKRWEAKPGETGLPSNPSVLLGLKDGSLWIAALGHMLRLQNGRLTDFLLPGAQSNKREVKVIQEGQGGALWVASSFGLSKFTQSRWQQVELSSNFKNPGVEALVIGRDDTVWAAVFDWGNPGSTRILFLRPGDSHFRMLFEPVGGVLSLSESRDGEIWLCQTMAPVRAIKNDLRSPYFTDKEIGAFAGHLLFDQGGNLWMSSPTRRLH